MLALTNTSSAPVARAAADSTKSPAMVIGASEEKPANAWAGVSTPVSTKATTPPRTATGAGTRSRNNSVRTTSSTAAVNHASHPTGRA